MGNEVSHTYIEELQRPSIHSVGHQTAAARAAVLKRTDTLSKGGSYADIDASKKDALDDPMAGHAPQQQGSNYEKIPLFAPSVSTYALEMSDIALKSTLTLSEAAGQLRENLFNEFKADNEKQAKAAKRAISADAYIGFAMSIAGIAAFGASLYFHFSSIKEGAPAERQIDKLSKEIENLENGGDGLAAPEIRGRFRSGEEAAASLEERAETAVTDAVRERGGSGDLIEEEEAAIASSSTGAASSSRPDDVELTIVREKRVEADRPAAADTETPEEINTPPERRKLDPDERKTQIEAKNARLSALTAKRGAELQRTMNMATGIQGLLREGLGKMAEAVINIAYKNEQVYKREQYAGLKQVVSQEYDANNSPLNAVFQMVNSVLNGSNQAIAAQASAAMAVAA